MYDSLNIFYKNSWLSGKLTLINVIVLSIRKAEGRAEDER
jgi:hypothetical protein